MTVALLRSELGPVDNRGKRKLVTTKVGTYPDETAAHEAAKAAQRQAIARGVPVADRPTYAIVPA